MPSRASGWASSQARNDRVRDDRTRASARDAQGVLASPAKAMTESIQRATCELSDGSRIELAVTRATDPNPPDARGGALLDLPSAEQLLGVLKQHIAAARLPKPALAVATRGLVGKSPSLASMVRMIEK